MVSFALRRIGTHRIVFDVQKRVDDKEDNRNWYRLGKSSQIKRFLITTIASPPPPIFKTSYGTAKEGLGFSLLKC